MRIVYTLIAILVCINLFYMGCVPGQGFFNTPVSEPLSKSDFLERYRSKALEFEEKGEIQKALYYWRIAGAIAPKDAEISRKVIQLEGVSEWLSNRHFRKGVNYFDKGKKEDALREFLLTLRYNPGHEEGLLYIKERYPSSSFLQYRVLPKDTYSGIAKKVYKDPQKGFLIADLTDSEEKGVPAPGTVILLPKLQDRSKMPIKIPAKTTAKNSSGTKVFNYEKGLTLADEHFKRGEYEEANRYLYPLLAIDPKNQKAHEIANKTCYDLGIKMERSNNPVEALRMFKKVNPEYLDVKKRIISLKVFLKERAEEHYLKGLKYFVEEDIERAIEEWNQTLYLDPEHEKAKKDLKKAKGLLEKLKKVD